MAGLPKLDRIDINILAQLQQNSRLTNVDLAEAVGLSPSPCLSRVRRLEKAGYITGYNARLNLVRLVDHITVFTEVTLQDHRREDFIKFESEIRRYDALVECHLISGGYDYLLKFVARSVSRQSGAGSSAMGNGGEGIGWASRWRGSRCWQPSQRTSTGA